MTLTRRSSTILAVTVLLAAAAVLVMIVGMNRGAPGGEWAYASGPGAEAEVEAVQVAGGLTTKDIDLPAVQAHCSSQTDQHYDDCVTVNQVLDALAGDCTDCTDLTYIYSTTTGRVIKILLLRKGLKGHIPAEIGSLEMLEELWLYTNELSGTIPPEMGNLANLTWLFVSDNDLSGQIPETLNNLSLDRLWLHNNDFTGCVPYNLTLTREYKVDSGLAACAAPAGDGTPTPVPTASSGTPTPTPTAPAGTPTPSPTPEPDATPTPTPQPPTGDNTAARLTAVEGRLTAVETRVTALEATRTPVPQPPLISPPSDSPAVGSTVEAGASTYRVNEVRDPAPGELIPPDDGNRYLAADVTQMAGEDGGRSSWSNFSAQDSEGYIYDGTLWADLEPIFDSGVIGAGQTVRGWVTFEVPESAVVITIRIRYDYREPVKVIADLTQ